jgi:AcrR family transcriptional regulator
LSRQEKNVLYGSKKGFDMRVKTEERRLAIIEKASKVFEEKGYSGTTMAEISERVGGSKATLYGYFPSKDDLFVAVLEDGINRDASETARLMEPPGALEDRLRAFARAYAKLTVRPDIMRLKRLVISEAERSGIGKRIYDIGPGPFARRGAEILAAEMEAGTLRKADPVRAVNVLDALLQGPPMSFTLLGVIDHIDEADVIAAADHAVDIFLRAYAPE